MDQASLDLQVPGRCRTSVEALSSGNEVPQDEEERRMNIAIEIKVRDGRLVVQLIENDDQGGVILSEDYISIRELKWELDKS